MAKRGIPQSSTYRKAAIRIACVLLFAGSLYASFVFGFKVGAWAQYQYDRQIMQQYFRGQPQEGHLEDTAPRYRDSAQ